jgi:hypothetical protein
MVEVSVALVEVIVKDVEAILVTLKCPRVPPGTCLDTKISVANVTEVTGTVAVPATNATVPRTVLPPAGAPRTN